VVAGRPDAVSTASSASGRGSIASDGARLICSEYKTGNAMGRGARPVRRRKPLERRPSTASLWSGVHR